MSICKAKLPSGIFSTRIPNPSRKSGVLLRAKTEDVVKRRRILSGSGFTSSQADSLLISFVLSDDSPPSKAEVTLELVTALEPLKQTLSDISKKQDELANRITIVTGLLIFVDLVTFLDSPVVNALQGVATKPLTG